MLRKFRNLDKVEELETLKNTFAECQKWWKHQDSLITAIKRDWKESIDETERLKKENGTLKENAQKDFEDIMTLKSEIEDHKIRHEVQEEENDALKHSNEYLKKQIHDLRELNKRFKKGMKK